MINSSELSCKEVVELVTDYLEQALLPEMRAKVDEHLTNCPGCALYYIQVWQSLPENNLDSSTISVYLQQLIQGLVLELQEILTLRDIEGWTADEVCSLLEITDESQRVLLHHARTQIRHGLEQYFSKERI